MSADVRREPATYGRGTWFVLAAVTVQSAAVAAVAVFFLVVLLFAAVAPGWGLAALWWGWLAGAATPPVAGFLACRAWLRRWGPPDLRPTRTAAAYVGGAAALTYGSWRVVASAPGVSAPPALLGVAACLVVSVLLAAVHTPAVRQLSD